MEGIIFPDRVTDDAEVLIRVQRQKTAEVFSHLRIQHIARLKDWCSKADHETKCVLQALLSCPMSL